MFFRTPAAEGLASRFPILKEIALMRQTERRIEEAIREVAPDIVHAHSPVLNALPAIRAGRRAGLPVVYEVRAFWEDAAASHGTSTEQGPRYRATRALETFALRRADGVTTICEGLRTDIVTRGIPSEKVTVIPNAVNAEEFASGEPDPSLARSLGLDGKTVLGFLGSFYSYEGLDMLCRAMPGIVVEQPNAMLLLVGGGPEENALKALVAELGIEDRVVFTGRVPHDEVQKYYDLVDLLVYPRVPIRLTELVTPLKPLEAMAMGKMLVASNVGGHRELIRDGETGTLFAAGDVDDLATVVSKVLSDRTGWPAMIEAGHRFVETERTWKRSVANYTELYERLLADREFLDVTAADPGWRIVMDDPKTERFDLPDADHTLSRADWSLAVSDRTADWCASLAERRST